MATPKEVKLFGAAISGYCTVVHHALRLKGVVYDYVEVDLKNKSKEFLELNPVHKKVPVLVVDGKPIPESLVILQYVDETWKEEHPLLPQDSYLRSKVLFWADFIYHKMGPLSYAIRTTEGEAQNKAVEEFMGHLKTLEDGINKDIHVHGPFIHGEEPGLLDVILRPFKNGFQHLEQMIAGMKLLDKEHIPLLCSYMDAYAELAVVKDTELMLSQYGHA
ncbi:glutathione S-transferase U10-like protein [Carex littledalei]|uniref:Glutathione S-transferase n=1 Tax=Carex littledalei TaxID=544730 RepID=A0A833VFK5_9POAL|nr:glutathione S-transferase U10-like protein [Carex littledalei]